MNAPTKSIASKIASSVATGYTRLSEGVQNYGANIEKNREMMKPKTYYGAINPFPNPLKSASYKKP